MADKVEAWLEKDWRETGITWLVVVRERAGGLCELGVLLVDPWCLGVRDAFADLLERRECDALLDEQIPAQERVAVAPACARKLAEGAVAYAQGLGFLPHRDFKKVRKLFGSIKTGDCPDVFEFGRGGRPCFVASEGDDEARVRRVLAILTARMGPEGFDFIDPATDKMDVLRAEEDRAIDVLYQFIDDRRCPDAELTPYGAHGFVTGLWIQPDLIQPSEWQPLFWGAAAAQPTFAGEAEGREVVGALFTLYNRIGDDLRDDDYFVDLPPADDPLFTSFAAQHSAGVLRGLGLRPTVLAWLRSHPEGAPAVALLERCARAEVEASDSLEDELVDAITLLADLAGELQRLA